MSNSAPLRLCVKMFYATVANSGFLAVFGCTSGTEGPLACLKCTFDRNNKVPRHISASGNTTLKFFPIYR